MLNVLVMRAKISKTAEPPLAAAASADACRRLREGATKARAARRRRNARSRPERRRRKKPLREGATKARAARRRRKARSRPERRSRKRHSVGAKQRKEKIFSFFWGRGRGCLLLIVWGVLVAGLFWAVLRG